MSLKPFQFDPILLEKASQFLMAGQVIALKTDTVPGLAVLEDFSSRLFALKKRPISKPVVLFYADIKEVKKDYVVSANAEKYLEKYWPGGLTFILLKKNDHRKVGIRIPRDAFIKRLIERVGQPLAVTSANKSGEKEILSMTKVQEKFKDQIALAINQRKDSLEKVSTVVDLTEEKPIVLRQGAIEFNT